MALFGSKHMCALELRRLRGFCAGVRSRARRMRDAQNEFSAPRIFVSQNAWTDIAPAGAARLMQTRGFALCQISSYCWNYTYGDLASSAPACAGVRGTTGTGISSPKRCCATWEGFFDE